MVRTTNLFAQAARVRQSWIAVCASRRALLGEFQNLNRHDVAIAFIDGEFNPHGKSSINSALSELTQLVALLKAMGWGLPLVSTPRRRTTA